MPQNSKILGETLPEEIRELERLLEEKKKALAEKGIERETKELFREVFREHLAPAEEAKVPLPPSDASKKRAATPPSSKTAGTQDYEEEIRSLIKISFEKGVREAVAIAKRETPWLLDELHDRLIDEYYQKLVSAGKIGNP